MSTLTYRGYSATVEFDSEDMILTGRIAGINDVIGFHAETPAELLAAIHAAHGRGVAVVALTGKNGGKLADTLLHLEFDFHVQVDCARHIRAVHRIANSESRGSTAVLKRTWALEPQFRDVPV